jgi:4-oxalocrotonate tautomerase
MTLSSRALDGALAHDKDNEMPHVIVKLYSGRTDAQKARLAEEITKAVIAGVGSADKSISVSIEDVAPEDWTEKVYKPDIVGKPETLFKKPGYEPA